MRNAKHFASCLKKAINTKAAYAALDSGSGGTYTCNCSKTCPNMSCAEAQYQLNVCGCSARDADDDGTACDSQCQ